ncbi:MAG: endonuclease/exonuclease/phosphatase family protein [Candidatus Aenigmarchaeota archaeon]|nr:endonuclease/exonuclease/phosphatase family protein [Candidatus Aenigmarchaeota archaeon]
MKQSKPLRLLTLNLWGGKLYDRLLPFLKEQAKRTDIFCFQEVFDNPPGVESRMRHYARGSLYKDLQLALPAFRGILSSPQQGEKCIAIFARKTLRTAGSGEVYVYRHKDAMAGADPSTMGITLQHLALRSGRGKVTVCNLHGHWYPGPKGDTPARLEQSRNVRRFLKTLEGPVILCGDFNLNPQTRSLRLLEQGMRNLVKEAGVTSTRSSFYQWPSLFADYILVSRDLVFQSFAVLPDEVSDHLPLALEFSL